MSSSAPEAIDWQARALAAEEALARVASIVARYEARRRAISEGKLRRTHGEGRSGMQTSEYRSWRGMLSRCHNKNSAHYDRYGGRGITVFDGWVGKGGYDLFLAHIGRKPTKSHTIDRINPDGNYEPCNVRWATTKQQCRNKSTTVWLTLNGERHTVPEWSEITGIKQVTIRARLKSGWTVADALQTAAGSKS